MRTGFFVCAMWSLIFLHLLLISPSFGASEGLCFVILAFPGYLHLSSRKHAYIILAPLKPHFYIVKLVFTGVCIIFFCSKILIVGTR